MTDTLRDRLAAVLGPGNNDTNAHDQTDAILDVLLFTPNRELNNTLSEHAFNKFRTPKP